MLRLNLEEIRMIVGGRWVGGHRPAQSSHIPVDVAMTGVFVTGISNDSRTLVRGDLYVALHGERFDGHAFLKEAHTRGAVAALLSREDVAVPPELPCVLVSDTLVAMGDIARHYRASLPDTRIIAVAGSCGKTTTREMIAAVLSTVAPVHRNDKNHNNRVGVPQTIFGLETHHRFGVIEIGTSEPGEIAALTAIVQPDQAVMTCIDQEHLERLGSIEGVIVEEAELFRGMGEDGVAIINFDDANSLRARHSARCRVVSYGFDRRCEVRGGDIDTTTEGTEFRLNDRHRFRLNIFGRHNVSNALAAIAAGWVNGVPVEKMRDALERFRPVDMRSDVEQFLGVTVIDDCYNANPASMRAGLQTLSDMRGRQHRIACLGDMLELGATAEEAHVVLGWYVATRQVDLLVAVGPLMRIAGRRVEEYGVEVRYFDDPEDAGRAIADLVEPRDAVLFKGSRGMHMDRALKSFKEKVGGADSRSGQCSRIDKH